MGVRVGTSGWSYRHWRGCFYPEEVPQKRWLEYYADRFDTVELNASFYRLPRESTFQGWRQRTPEGFLFAVKASGLMTHRRRLSDCSEPLERFFTAAGRLGDKLAVVMFQLPPSFRKDTGLLVSFLCAARAAAGEAPRFAFEFRDESWLSPDCYAALQEHKAALVFADWGKLGPMAPVTADFVYLRRHGPKSDYASPYSADDIGRDAASARGWLAEGLDLFAYYNNDFGGHAIRNARALAAAIGE